MMPGVGVDQLQDLRRLGIRDGPIGTALLFDTHTVVGVAGGAVLEGRQWDRTVKAVDGWLKHGATSWKERAFNLLPLAVAQISYERYTKIGRSAKSETET